MLVRICTPASTTTLHLIYVWWNPVCLCVSVCKTAARVCIPACNCLHYRSHIHTHLIIGQDHLIKIHIQRKTEGGKGRWKHVRCLPADVWNKIHSQRCSSVSAAGEIVFLSLCRFACVEQSSSLPPSLPLALAPSLSLSLSLYFSISLTLCICSPLCGHHHNACGHTSLGKLFSGDDPQPRTNTHA